MPHKDHYRLFSTPEDTSFAITQAELLANASDIDGDTLSVTDLTIPHASVETLTDDAGVVSYRVTPELNYNGNVDISYKVL
jgi:hypothetical protein